MTTGDRGPCGEEKDVDNIDDWEVLLEAARRLHAAGRPVTVTDVAETAALAITTVRSILGDQDDQVRAALLQDMSDVFIAMLTTMLATAGADDHDLLDIVERSTIDMRDNLEPLLDAVSDTELRARLRTRIGTAYHEAVQPFIRRLECENSGPLPSHLSKPLT